MNYWQIGSGQGDRKYIREFLDYGIAAVGGDSDTMKDVKENDIVVLRDGARKIAAVGKVIKHEGEFKGLASDENKSWLKDFDGWDLPAYCYVEWREPPQPEMTSGRMARQPICKLHQPDVRERAMRILDGDPYPSNYDGPSPTRKIEDGQIQELLNRSGIDAKAANAAISTMNDIRRLAGHYYDYGYENWPEVKEHEIRTFLIIPLLLALGWEETRIKIELSPGRLGVADGRKSIDVACFCADYQPGCEGENKENCKLIIESKRFSSGIAEDAPGQAKEYAQNLPDCELVLASNGYCYKAFRRKENGEVFSDEPCAYLNLRRPTEKYPLYPDKVDGALEVLRLLLPQTWC